MNAEGQRVLAQFRSEDGATTGAPFDLPVETTHESLLVLCNALLENVRGRGNFLIKASDICSEVYLTDCTFSLCLWHLFVVQLINTCLPACLLITVNNKSD